MSLIAGITGQKTELFDGAKIDAISEYTVGNGVSFDNQVYATGSFSGAVGLDQAVTLTNKSNRFQVVTLTAARIYTLPTTGIRVGDTFTFVNRATNNSYRLTINSSGGNAVDWIVNGKITVMAVQDTPTTAAHWATLDAVIMPTAFTPTVASSSGSITSYSSLGRYSRNGKVVTLNMYYFITNNGTGTGYGILGNFPIPVTTYSGYAASGVSRLSGTTGAMVSYDLTGGNTFAAVRDNNNSYPWANNAETGVTIVYQMD